MTGPGIRDAGDAVIPILRFRAGGITLAIAAEAASGFGPPSPGVAHIGELVGIDVAADQPGRRLLRLEDNGAVAQVIVDGPVVLQPIGPGDILPPLGAPPLGPRSPLVLGHAAAGGVGPAAVDGPVVLLDVERVIALAAARAAGDEGAGADDDAPSRRMSRP